MAKYPNRIMLQLKVFHYLKQCNAMNPIITHSPFRMLRYLVHYKFCVSKSYYDYLFFTKLVLFIYACKTGSRENGWVRGRDAYMLLQSMIYLKWNSEERTSMNLYTFSYIPRLCARRVEWISDPGVVSGEKWINNARFIIMIILPMQIHKDALNVHSGRVLIET